MVQFLRRYHDWNCRRTNNKQFSMAEHFGFGLTGFVLLAGCLALLLGALSVVEKLF